jgi:predicted nucleic acid-binding Zn ribbon protein
MRSADCSNPTPRSSRRVPTPILVDAWRDVAGESIASQTEVRSLRLGVLTIAVGSPPLCQELAAFRRIELTDAMHARTSGRVKEIRFRLGTP